MCIRDSFLPEPQPSTDFFMMVKYGDNDGRTIVIDKRGKIFNMIGGRYFITKDNRFLFSPWVSLEKGLAAVSYTHLTLPTSDLV